MYLVVRDLLLKKDEDFAFMLWGSKKDVTKTGSFPLSYVHTGENTL